MTIKQATANLNLRNQALLAGSIFLLFLFQGCTGINTFPTIARPGDTVTMMLGGSEQVSKDTIDVTLVQGSSTWNLADPNGDSDRSDSKIRSVFEVRTDGRARGLNYNNGQTMNQIWAFGHEPVQSMMIVDLPPDVQPGEAFLHIAHNVTDNSSSTPTSFDIALTIVDVPGTSGASDSFLRTTTSGAVGANLSELEPAPHAKVSFGPYGQAIYAASLEVDFDETVVTPTDLNVYIPEAIIGGTLGSNQRMAYWRQDGDKVYIDIIAPNSIKSQYLKVYIMHPPGVTADPAFILSNATFYDQNGVDVTYLAGFTETLEYFP